MDRWHAMRVFLKVAKEEGFAEAARQLNMSPPAVTRAVAALEDAIGARLFIRTTRGVKLTEAGSRYAQDCRRILADLEEADATAAGSYVTPTGVLTVTAPVSLGQMCVLPILGDYLCKHPTMTGRALFLDRVTNIVDEGIDVAIRIGHFPQTGLRTIPVGHVRQVVCGAPAYFEKRGVPNEPADLAMHTIVAPSSASASLDWRFGHGQTTVVTVRPRLYCNTNEAIIASAIAGWGLARALCYKIRPAIADGRLRAVLTEYEEEPLPVQVVYAEGAHVGAKVRSFVDFAVSGLRANKLLNWDAPQPADLRSPKAGRGSLAGNDSSSASSSLASA